MTISSPKGEGISPELAVVYGWVEPRDAPNGNETGHFGPLHAQRGAARETRPTVF